MQKHRAKEEDWNRLVALNKPVLRQFYMNVDRLCILRYKSRSRAMQVMAARGFTGNSDTVRRYKEGIYTDSSLSNLSKWCDLFGVSLIDMMVNDYSQEVK